MTARNERRAAVASGTVPGTAPAVAGVRAGARGGMRTPLGRRSVLRGAAGVAIGLPLLEAMHTRSAHAAAIKRFVFFYHPNGVCRDTWTPTGTESDFTLPFALEPLEALKSKLVVFQGVNMESARKNPGNGHNVGITNLLTARKFILEQENMGFGAKGWGADASIDQVIATRLGPVTKFSSLQFGVQTFKQYGASAYSFISYSGPKMPLPNENDPVVMFNRVFAGVGGSSASQAERIAKRKSVLDSVTEDFRQLSGRLGAQDKGKVDAHLAKVREIERRLTLVGPTSAACKRPTVSNPAGGVNLNANYPAIGKMQMDLLAMAFACDLTRVATLQWACAQSDVNYAWAMAPKNHHVTSHNTDEESIRLLKLIQRWLMGQLAYLGQALDDAKEDGKEGATSILDSTALLSGSEVAVGNTHTFVDMPFLLLGGCGGAIRTGRFMRYTNATHADLYVSMLNAMGLPATTFGEPGFSKGPLAGLVG